MQYIGIKRLFTRNYPYWKGFTEWVFNDCDYPFAGTTLGDAFGIHNTDRKANAYDFNILFWFHSTSEATFDFSVSRDAVGYGFSCDSKFGDIDGADFDNNLKTKDYAKNVDGIEGKRLWQCRWDLLRKSVAFFA